MKKVININFQGRVVPIEEPAFEELRNYTDGLRRYFSEEEGRDEIINDIENRIAELFSERLKKKEGGCITEADLQEIMASIGRPEDFDGDESGMGSSSTEKTNNKENKNIGQFEPKGSFYRNNSDKILGGVCAGFAQYLRIDPSIVRIIFAIFTLGSFGSALLLYIILWIVLPAKNFDMDVRRRLFRNPDEKTIGGVCSGIASYFNIAVWIPRIVFALPFILSILGNIFSNSVFEIIFDSFSGTFILAYIILWIVVPMAHTASEKLEMRGEKVDLESIRQSVNEERHGVKSKSDILSERLGARAEEWGGEVRDSVRDSAQAIHSQAAPLVKSAGRGIGHAIGVLFKVFFLFILSIITFALFVGLVALIIVSLSAIPLKDFFLHGFWQHATAWGTLILFLGVPVVALIVWLIRRIFGFRSRNNYLGYIFSTLWVFGWVSVTVFAGLTSRQFKRDADIREKIELSQPSNGRLEVDMGETPGRYYKLDWIETGDDDMPAVSTNEDSMLLNTLRIRIVKSKDSLYHATTYKIASGETQVKAEESASKIRFDLKQEDSILFLQKGFGISKTDTYHNQKIILILEVPVGKSIKINESTDWFDWFSVRGNGTGITVRHGSDDDMSALSWNHDVWYTMTSEGLERIESLDNKEKDWNSEVEEKDKKKNGVDINLNKDSLKIRVNGNDTIVSINLSTSNQPNRIHRKPAKNMKPVEKEENVAHLAYAIPLMDILKLGF